MAVATKKQDQRTNPVYSKYYKKVESLQVGSSFKIEKKDEVNLGNLRRALNRKAKQISAKISVRKTENTPKARVEVFRVA